MGAFRGFSFRDFPCTGPRHQEARGDGETTCTSSVATTARGGLLLHLGGSFRGDGDVVCGGALVLVGAHKTGIVLNRRARSAWEAAGSVKRIHHARLIEAQFQVGKRCVRVLSFYGFTNGGRDEVNDLFDIMHRPHETEGGILQIWVGDANGHIGPGVVVDGVYFGAGRAQQATTATGKKWAELVASTSLCIADSFRCDRRRT